MHVVCLNICQDNNMKYIILVEHIRYIITTCIVNTEMKNAILKYIVDKYILLNQLTIGIIPILWDQCS